jgi:dGTPase
MATHGGFEHNSQSLRIVEVLEERYAEFSGLNLTYEVREGIVKHSTRYDRPRVADFNPDEAPLLEAQIVDFADEIAYNCHDIDDGIQSGLLTVEDLAGLDLWEAHFAAAKTAYPSAEFSILRYQTVRRLLDMLVRDLISTIEKRIDDAGVETVADVRSIKPRLAEFSDDTRIAMALLKARLMKRLYRHQRVRRMGAKARRVMTGIFEAYMEDPLQMPPHVVARVRDDLPVARVVADYIAGMTDRFALAEYAKLYDPYEKV